MVGNSGRYSKFQQRLKNIYLSWILKKKKKKIVQDKFIEDKVEEIKREFSFSVEVENTSVSKDVRKIKLVKGEYVGERLKEVKKESVQGRNDGKLAVEQNIATIKEFGNDKVIINDNFLKKVRDNKKKGVYFVTSKSDKSNSLKKVSSGVGKVVVRDSDIELSKVELINKLKNKFIEKEAELEVLESELFLISDISDNSLDYSEVSKLRERIKNIIVEINSIIEQYNLYNKNSDLSSVIGIDDDYLVDDIIDYRNLLDSSSDRKKFVKEYKLLDEFKSLYLKLESIKVEVNNVNKSNEDIINKYDIRDKKYDEVKIRLLNIKDLNKDYLEEIKKQNEFLDELAKKISVIDSEEVVTKRLVGLNELLMQGFKFLGLKLLSPFSGFIPSIVGETIVTKNMIKSIYKNLHYESVSRMYYSAVDFDRDLNEKINDINYTEILVNDTFSDLKKVKEEFFSIYDVNIPGYEDTLRNISKMEDVMYKNQCRVKFVKDRLRLSKKVNSDKMIKVKRLNESRS